LAACVLASNVAAAAEGDVYARHPIFRQEARSCELHERGRFQAWCEYVELGSVDGVISPLRAQKDARWPTIRKYWNNTQRRLKFVGAGCARADSRQEAEALASARGAELVKGLIGEFEAYYFGGRLKPLAYRKSQGATSCRPMRSEEVARAGDIALTE
jgi:hypothetical protein